MQYKFLIFLFLSQHLHYSIAYFLDNSPQQQGLTKLAISNKRKSACNAETMRCVKCVLHYCTKRLHCTLIDKNHASIVQRLQEPLCLAKQLVLQARIYHKCIDSKKSYGHKSYIKAFFCFIVSKSVLISKS